MSKTNATETRRPLGVCFHRSSTRRGTIADWGVANPAQGRQRVSHPERVRVRDPRHEIDDDQTTKWDNQGQRGQAHGNTGVGSVCFIVGRSKRALDLAVPEDEAIQRLI